VGHGVTQEVGPFEVHLTNFEGPFDLLLGLIAKHQLDITDVALSAVTDEFIEYIRRHGTDWPLEVASEFLVVAATLLDLKAARLLPSGEVEDEEDLAVLEARDLLFARLLQYRAFKEAAALVAARLETEALRHPRAVPLEERFSALLPDVVLGIGPAELARLAAQALTPKPTPTVSLDHVHAPRVSVREQAELVVARLQRQGTMSFRALAHDAPTRLHVVARFLALLELYRDRLVGFDQLVALGDLTVRWLGQPVGPVTVHDEFDEEDPVDEETQPR
jgi:segregation and condensation protein A